MRYCLAFLLVACGTTAASGPDTVRLEAGDNTLALNETTSLTVTLLNSQNKAFTGTFEASLSTNVGRFGVGGDQRVTVDLTNNTATVDFVCDVNGTARITATVDALTSSTLSITCGTGSGTMGTTGTTGVTGVTGVSGVSGVSGTSGNMGGTTSLSELALSSERATILTSSTTTITAAVKGANGMQAPDGSVVVFMVSGGGMLSSTTGTTTAGVASVSYTAPANTGGYTISASYTDSTGTTRTATVDVAVVSVAVCMPNDIDPQTIRVKGSVGPNATPISFVFLDAENNPVPEGLTVSFSLSANASDGVQLTPTTVETNNNGVASTILFAGGQAETVSVIATATQGATTVSGTSDAVSIISGIPEYSHLSWGCELNSSVIKGMWVDGAETKCSFRVADRFSNSVDTGTLVNFRTEAGHVNANAVVNGSGVAEAVIQSADPRPTLFWTEYVPSTREVRRVVPIPAVSNAYQRFPHRPTPAGAEMVAPSGSTGPLWEEALVRDIPRITLIGITQGEETFVDTNANDVYDMGEPFIDLGEPFVDKNDNGQQDTCMIGALPGTPFTSDDEEFFNCYEPFIDLDGDGQWDAGNQQWDNWTSIWKVTHISWTDVEIPQIYPSGISNGNNDLLDDNIDPRLDATYGVASRSPVILGSGGVFPAFTFRLDVLDQFLNCDLRGDKYTVSSVGVTGIDDVDAEHFGPTCRDTIVLTDGATAPRAGTSVGTLRVEVHVDASDTDWILTWPVQIDP